MEIFYTSAGFVASRIQQYNIFCGASRKLKAIIWQIWAVINRAVSGVKFVFLRCTPLKHTAGHAMAKGRRYRGYLSAMEIN